MPYRGEPFSHLAIMPYPGHLESHWQLKDGTQVTLRPIRPEDADAERSFVNALSSETKYFRFLQHLTELTPEMLVRFTQIDYDREMAYIAVVAAEQGEAEIAVARYVINPDGETCEFAIVVGDAWQGHGIGGRLMAVLMDDARRRGLKEIQGDVLSDNRKMLSLMDKLGFVKQQDPEDPVITKVTKVL